MQIDSCTHLHPAAGRALRGGGEGHGEGWVGTGGCLIFNVRDCHTNSGRGAPGRGGGTQSAYALSF